MRLGRTEEGLANFREARQRYGSLGDSRGVAVVLLDEAMGNKERDPSEQIRLIREALETLKGTRHQDLKLDAYSRLVWALFERPRVDEAMEAFGEERRLLRRLGRTRTLARRTAEVCSLRANVRLHR